MTGRRNDEPEPDELRAAADEYEAIADAVEALAIELRDEPVKESRLEGLFDEVTTSNPQIWNTVTAFVDVRDGEAVVTDESKLAEGSWAPEIVEGCDAMLTLDVSYGMMPDEFEYAAGKEIQRTVDEFRERASEARETAERLDESDTDDSVE